VFSNDKKDKFFSLYFTSKPNEKMLDIAENFIPEYANVLCALIGAKFI
jgi:hypothetical protein